MHKFRYQVISLAILFFLVSLIMAPTILHAQYTNKVIVFSEQEVPGIPGAIFSSVVPPAGIGLSDSGKAVFSAYLEFGAGGITIDNDQGVWVYEADSIRLLVQKGGAVPRFTQAYFLTDRMPEVFMDPTGQIGVNAHYATGGGAERHEGFFIEENGVLVQKLYSGMILPTGDTLSGISGAAFNNGRVLFAPALKGPSVRRTGYRAAICSYYNGVIDIITIVGNAPTGLAGADWIIMSGGVSPALTADGKFIYTVNVFNTSTRESLEVLYSWDPINKHTILKTNDRDVTNLTVFGNFQLNSQGNYIRRSFVTLLNTSYGLFDIDDNLIIAEGDIAIGANGESFHQIGNSFGLTDNDTVVFMAYTTDFEPGIWAGDKSGIKKIVRVGDLIPDENDRTIFTRVHDMLINRKGNVVISDLAVDLITDSAYSGVWIGGVSRPLQLVVRDGDFLEIFKDSFLTVYDPTISSSFMPKTGGDGTPSEINNEAEFLFSTYFVEGGNALVLAVGPGLLVNSNGDAPDIDSTDGVCFTGNTLPDGRPECTLRAAITEANNQEGPNKIKFDIKEIPTISPRSALPEIKDTLLIDGFSQPNNEFVIIDGVNAGLQTDGLSLRGSAITIQGLTIGYFSGNGISIKGTDSQPAENNKIYGCFVGYFSINGTDFGNGINGIYLNNASNNEIGGYYNWQQNYISSNIQHGINLRDSSKNNQILNNYIGWTFSDSTLGNGGNGISMSFGCDSNFIGDSFGSKNIISGNGMNGIFTQRSHANIIEGNIIGRNNEDGIFIDYESTHNRIISNTIGLTENGNFFGNKLNGVYINNNSNMNYIGGGSDSGNVISGNMRNGILIYQSDENIIGDNYIGTDLTGLVYRGNKANGVLLDKSSSTFIENRNVISGNDSSGVLVQNFSNTNMINGNLIGVGKDSSTALPNLWGVTIYESPQNEIISNEINNNEFAGILLLSDSCDVHFNTIISNGSNKLDSTGIYGGDGIYVNGMNNLITAPSIFGVPGKQEIANNHGSGVHVVEAANRNNYFNTIQFNQIYDNMLGGIDLDPIGTNERDTLDDDDGANSKINAPLLYSAIVSSVNHLNIYGSVLSKPNERFFYDIYGNEMCDSLGLGQGEEYLFSGFVDTDPLGRAVINYTDSTLLFVPNTITMTVTDDYGNTSEFSNCVNIISSGVDLRITKTDFVDTVTIFDSILYQIEIINFGPETANNVVVVDSLPSQIQYISDTVSQGTSMLQQNILTYNIGSLDPNSTATIKIATKANIIGEVINYTVVNSTSNETIVSNNIAVDTTFIKDIATDIDDFSNNNLPTFYALSQNYPNPFNPSTEISFSLPEVSDVTLTIFNLLGQEVTTLFQGNLKAGIHTFSWNSKMTASGIYLYKLTADEFTETKKMVLLK